jgi:hypothetical protein
MYVDMLVCLYECKMCAYIETPSGIVCLLCMPKQEKNEKCEDQAVIQHDLVNHTHKQHERIHTCMHAGAQPY